MPKTNHLKATFWFTLSLFIDCMDDVLTKYLGDTLHPWQVIFFRLTLGGLTLLPVLLRKYGRKGLITQRSWLHLLRGSLLVLAMGLWGVGLTRATLMTATLMGFTVPIFVLIMSPMVLQERVSLRLWLVTILGFFGIALALQKETGNWGFHPAALYFVPGAALFGSLDVLNRKYIHTEPQHCTLLYSTLLAGMLSFPLAWPHWVAPSLQQLALLMLLGIGGNLILYCLLKAFSMTQLGILEPLRYLELLISAAIGFVLFRELPGMGTYLGAAVIIPCSLYIVITQARKPN